MEKYKVLGKLGDGTFGKVTKAVNKKTNEVVAIKAMKQKFYNWEECMNLREVKSLRKLNHETIVKLKEVVRVNNDLYFVFEYVEKNLYQVMKDNNNQVKIKDIKSIMYQTLQGLAYIHKNGFFHRDMKPENILMTDDKVKIADFGLAREIRSKPPYTDYVSTRWYRAPELLLRSTNYNSPVDIFAAGCILAELVLGRPLFAGTSEADQLMKVFTVLGSPSKTEWPEGHKLSAKLGYKFPTLAKTPLADLMPDTPVDLIDLLEKMLIYDPNNRPTAQQCLEHDFFEGVNIESIASASDSFKNKIISNQNNKLISSKLMRMTSKKYDLDSKDEKGTIYSKTSDSDKQASDKRININKFGGFPVVKNEIGSGFYVKNKPIKSPSTPSSSNSQHFGTKPQFGSKIKYGGIPYKKKEISEQTPENSSKSFANYEVRQSRFGMGKGDSDTDRNMNSIYDNDGGRGMPNVTPPPVPIPLSIMGSGGLGGGLGGLGGGGLTRGNALSLGRHQI